MRYTINDSATVMEIAGWCWGGSVTVRETELDFSVLYNSEIF